MMENQRLKLYGLPTHNFGPSMYLKQNHILDMKRTISAFNLPEIGL